jgi:hypothetical protein
MEDIHQKKGLHLDEVLSIIISDCNGFGYQIAYEEEKVHTGREVKKQSLWNNASVTDALSDVKRLYLDNRDRPHTNLYYSCFRLWFTGMDTANLREIIEHGCLLNLVFFTLSFLFMHKLLQHLLSDQRIIPFTLLLGFSNIGAISNSLLLRPYQLQETLLIAFTYSFVRCNEKVDRREILDGQCLYQLILATGLTMLSGYFACIYVLMMFWILVLKSVREGPRDNVTVICAALLVAILLARTLYQGFFYGFSCGRAGEAYKKFAHKVFWDNLRTSMNAFQKIIGCTLYDLRILLFTAVCAGYVLILDRRSYSVPIVFLVAFIWSFLCILIAPFKELRYIMPCFPIMSSISPIMIVDCQKWIRYIFLPIMLLFLKGPWVPGALLLHCYPDQQNFVYFLEQNKNTPILVLADQAWKCSYILHLFCDEQRYEFPRSLESLNRKLMKYDSAIVFISDYYNIAEWEAEISKNFFVEKIKKRECFMVYRVQGIAL